MYLRQFDKSSMTVFDMGQGEKRCLSLKGNLRASVVNICAEKVKKSTSTVEKIRNFAFKNEAHIVTAFINNKET